ELPSSARLRSHRPVSSATEAVYFKCVQESLDISQAPPGKLRYLAGAKKIGRSAATDPPKRISRLAVLVPHVELLFAREREGLDGCVLGRPHRAPRGAQHPAAVLSGLPGPTAKPTSSFAFCHLDIRPVDL